MRGFAQKVRDVLASRRFYWAVLGFLVFEGLWITFSAVYPMAFDEDFHVGIIRIYSEQWLPFLAGQPENANQFGALATDPSYLYHYLMSFPYRLVSVFTDSQAAHVIVLRMLNVAMVAAGVVMFCRVLLRAGLSRAFTHATILLFTLVPTVPLLAGQVNYDNLMFLALAGVCWLVLMIVEELRARTVNIRTYVLLALLLLFASLVKYPFLPIALGTVLFVAFMLWRTFRSGGFVKAVAKGYAKLPRRTALALLALMVVGAGLFIQRYGYNLAVYHHPVPDCSDVLGIEACMEYGPWGRNYRYAASKPADFTPDPAGYVWLWLQGLHYRMFFMITGPPEHTNYPPALLPSAIAIAVLVFGLAALLFYWRQSVGGQPFLIFLLLITAVYAAALFFFNNYPQYVETGRPVAINGRYFIPLLLPMAAVFGRALSVAFRSIQLKVVAVLLVIVCFTQGGGVFSFILRSDPSWYWPNQAVVDVNTAAQKALDNMMFIGPKEY